MRTEYHKIYNVYARNELTRKLDEGIFLDDTVEYLADLPWIFTEKVDGTNIRIIWDGYRVSVKGRTDAAQLHPELLSYLNSKFTTPEAEEIFEANFREKEVVLYGEGYGAGIQKVGSLYRPDKSFILFDAKNSSGESYSRAALEYIASVFDIDVVPVVLEGTIAEGVEYVKTHKQSTLNPAAPLEGIVGHPKEELKDNQGNRVIVKIKCKDF